MQRRSFLKGLIGIGISLSPAGAVLKKLITAPTPIKELAPVIAEASKISKPFIITINNPTLETITHVDIFGAYKYLHNPDFMNTGELKVSVAEISSHSGLSHSELLKYSMANPVMMDRMILNSNNPKQFNSDIKIETISNTGMKAWLIINPSWYRTPYDTDINTVHCQQPFCIDGYTSLIFHEFLPKTKMNVYLYPAIDLNIYNPARPIGFTRTNQTYQDPKPFPDART